MGRFGSGSHKGGEVRVADIMTESRTETANAAVQSDGTAWPDVVRLHSVTKVFGTVRALVGVSAEFRAGVVTVVEGSNGSGKSTLLALVGTLARPTSGSVDHASLGRSSSAVRSVLGWVGHETLCYGELTGRENVELAAKLHGLPAAAAFEHASRRFELDAFAARPVRTYSRGQRQRIALARALVHGPKLVLLDEPTAGLDESSTKALERVVAEEAARGAIVVVVTHDRGFAERLGGERIALQRGRRVASATV